MIEYDDLSFSYGEGEERQLKDICLSVGRGEFVLLCGRSACGKTTAIKCINGLIPHFIKGRTEGTVTVKGRDVRDTPTYTLARDVGSVFQNPKTQFFNLDSGSELVFGMENLGREPADIRRRVEEVTEDLDIQNLRGRSVFRMSGGEKQILALASVYAVDPDIYVLDEPTANMDLESIERLRIILGKLKAMGKTVVISEHRLYFLRDLIDRAVYIEDGRIEHIWTRDGFTAMDDDERRRLGLRSFEMYEEVRGVPSERKDGILKVEGLSVSVKGMTLMRNVDLTADRGDIVAVTGRNGCGKTSFLRTLCGLAKESAGRITCGGTRMTWRKRRDICSMTMQDVVHQLFSDSVREEFSLLNCGCRDGDVEEILDILDLSHTADRHPMTLSGGQKQRLAVATSVMSGKDILILDEPTSGLDYGNMVRVSQVIRKAAADRIVFISTHDRELMDMVCNRELRIGGGTAEIYDI